jgi:starch synthase (maltosyl-transferring)
MKSYFKMVGPRRVVIDHVSPLVDGGDNPFKRVIGDHVHFRAHAFADSHDLITVELQIRRASLGHWQHLPMRAEGNDEFGAEFVPPRIGLYEYRVCGYIDHYLTWNGGFKAKLKAGESMDLELRIGAGLLQEAAARATGRAAELLVQSAAVMEDSKADGQQRIDLALNEEITNTARAHPRLEFATTTKTALMLVERERATFSTWYEYFPRSCADDGLRHGTFADAARRLPEIRRMGFNVVYFPPIHPIGRLHRKGRNNALVAQPGDVGSPWAIGAAEGGHKAVHTELGTLADFQAFIAEAARHQIEIALDIAFQCAPDHPWVKEHPAWFRWRPDGTVQYAENPPKKYQDILPLNFESADWEALWFELKSVFEFWIEQGVTIFRVDNPHTKAIEFWRWCILELKKDHPEVILLAEAFTGPKRKYGLAKAGFTNGYTYFTWRNTAKEMRQYIEELTRGEAREFFWPNFWPNTPDILHEDLQHGNRATFIGRYVLAATLSSSMGIYGPAYEVLDNKPFPGKEEYIDNEKYQLKAWDWNCRGNIKEEIARMNGIRNEHPAFQRTFNVSFIPTDNPHLIAYIKQNFDRTDQFIVVVNMDWQNKQCGTLKVPMAILGLPPDSHYRVKDLFDPRGVEYLWHGSSSYVEIRPSKSPAHIFHVLP